MNSCQANLKIQKEVFFYQAHGLIKKQLKYFCPMGLNKEIINVSKPYQWFVFLGYKELSFHLTCEN